MADQEKKRRAKKIKEEDTEEVTNEFYMPFEEAMKKLVKVSKEDIKQEETKQEKH